MVDPPNFRSSFLLNGGFFFAEMFNNFLGFHAAIVAQPLRFTSGFWHVSVNWSSIPSHRQGRSYSRLMSAVTAEHTNHLGMHPEIAYRDKIKVLTVLLLLAGFFIALAIAIFGGLTGLGFCPLNY